MQLFNLVTIAFLVKFEMKKESHIHVLSRFGLRNMTFLIFWSFKSDNEQKEIDDN